MNKRFEIDIRLLNEAKNGVENAFTELFSFYHQHVYNTILKMVKCQIDAEDLTMITFEKAFLNLEKYAPTYGFSSWLGKIARNTVLDFFDAKKRTPLDFIEIYDSYMHKSSGKNPEDLYINKELGERLDVAVNQLQENYKDVIRLRYYEDLKYGEIGEMLGMPEISVRTYTYRAMKKLQAITF